jgi:signal transduction histidine kinase
VQNHLPDSDRLCCARLTGLGNAPRTRREFTVFAVQDITDEKRRAVLERAFFNDVLDTATGLNGVLDPWPDVTPAEAVESLETASNVSAELLEQIRSYRDLIAAERGELRPNFEEIEADRLLLGLCDQYARSSSAEKKTIAPPVITGHTRFRSDAVLLSRVLGHLIKNALEASGPGEAIRVSFENQGGGPTFFIHNASYMPEKVQLQIFQRSFSTRGVAGRGIGTYTVKLMTERYLGGEVIFTSAPNTGTVFTVRLPPRGA